MSGHRAGGGGGGVCVWLTGLPGSGKSSVAAALELILQRRGVSAVVLDGDEVRRGLCRDLGFSPEDRAENVRRVAEVARLLVEADIVAIVALISPQAAARARAREIVGQERFVEVYLDCPLEVCEARDPKGLYERARRGELEGFTGVGAPYEVPEGPWLRIDTDMDAGAAESAARIVARLEARGHP